MGVAFVALGAAAVLLHCGVMRFTSAELDSMQGGVLESDHTRPEFGRVCLFSLQDMRVRVQRVAQFVQM